MCRSKPIHAVFMFMFVLGIAALYLLYIGASEFLGALLMYAYAGAVVILFLFVVMMIDAYKNAKSAESWSEYFDPELSLTDILFFKLTQLSLFKVWYFYCSLPEKIENSPGFVRDFVYLVSGELSTIHRMGLHLYRESNPLFYLISGVLFISLIGAIGNVCNYFNDPKVSKNLPSNDNPPFEGHRMDLPDDHWENIPRKPGQHLWDHIYEQKKKKEMMEQQREKQSRFREGPFHKRPDSENDQYRGY